MIIGKDTNPKNNVYHLGAKIIEVLKDSNKKHFDYFEVFDRINEKEKVSLNLFFLTLDWLFLLDVIENKNGYIYKCF